MDSSSRKQARRAKSDVRRIRRTAVSRSFAGLALAIALFFVANLLSQAIYATWSFGSERRISSQTAQVLRGISGVIEIDAVFDGDESRAPLRAMVSGVLSDLEESAKSISGLDLKVRMLDLNRDLAESTRLLRDNPVAPNSVLVKYGSKTIVLDEYDLLSATEETEGNGTADWSKIERLFAATIFRVTRPIGDSVYFLSGHGEFDPEDAHPITGASSLARLLTVNGSSVRKITLGKSGETIPEDCSLLVVPGPRTMIPQRETEKIARFLSNGGRALILLDSATANGLAPLLEHWGMQLDSLRNGETSRDGVLASAFAPNASLSRLSGTSVQFADPKSVSALQTTLPDGTNLEEWTFVDNSDRARIPVAVCAKRIFSGEDGRALEARLAVVGDADFIANSMLNAGLDGNALYFLALREWLTGRDIPPVLDPEQNSQRAGIETEKQWRQLGHVVALALPLGVLIFGIGLFVPIARRI